MKLFITRHPITNEIENSIVQGKDSGTISKNGLVQINYFIKNIISEKFSKIISGHAKRCEEMSKIIANERGIPVELSGLINEKNYGDAIGRHEKEAPKHIMKKYDGFKEYRNGESLQDIEKRADEFIETIHESKESNLLIVSHSIFLSILIGKMLKHDSRKARKELLMNNCALTIINFDPKVKEFELEKFNDFSYLKNIPK